MTGSTNYDQVRSLFADQFEADGDGFLYRNNWRNTPIRVTAYERDRFVREYNRRSQFIFWGMVIGLTGCVMLMVIFPIGTGGGDSDYEMYITVGLVFVLYLIVHRRVWRFPARDCAKDYLLGRRVHGLKYGNECLKS